MAKRILLAGLVGGFALFMWGYVSHMFLGLGDAGMQYLPQQQPVVQALTAAVPQAGLYMFPQGDAAGNLPADQIGGPHGLLIYHPSGASGMMGKQLVNEFILNVVMALLAAYLLSLAPGLTSYISRVGFVAALGLVAALMINIEYWNWYGFPTTFTVASIADKFIGFLVIGLVAAAFVKPGTARVMTMPRAA